MERILIVDDDPDLLKLLRLNLKEAGFSVATARTGIEALQRARSLPDLIILDLVLPEMDGFTVCETLRRERATAGIPVIILTGLRSELNRFAGLEGGANDYLTKPISPGELIARIRTLLAAPAGQPAATPANGPKGLAADKRKGLLEGGARLQKSDLPLRS